MIDLKHLQLIQAIHQQGSMTKAADLLHLTQPALSHQLKELEEKLSVNVFERRGRQLELTSVGDRLLETAARVLDEMDRATQDIKSLASGKAGVLRLTTECYTCYHWIPSVLDRFHKTFPEVDVQIITEATRHPRKSLQENEIDVAIVTHTDGLNENYEVTHLLEDEFICVVPIEHPWASRSYVNAEDFTTEHLISIRDFFYEGSRIYNTIFREKGISPRKVTTIPIATEAIIEMVKAKMGITIMASWVANSYLDRFPGLTRCRLGKEGTYRSWYIIHPTYKSTYFIRGFVNHVKAAFE